MMARPTGRIRWLRTTTDAHAPEGVFVLQQEWGWPDGDTYWEDVPTATQPPTLTLLKGTSNDS